MANLEETLFRDIEHKSDFVLKDGTGDLDTIAGLDNLKDALLRRLVTEPGTVIHRPEYGVGIKQYQNAPMTIANQRRLALRIEEQFLRDTRVQEITSISFEVSEATPDLLKIIVSAKIKGYSDQKIQFTPFGDLPN